MSSASQSPNGFSLLQKLIESRSSAHMQMFAELRRLGGGLPLLNAGLGMAEQMSRSCVEAERAFVSQVNRTFAQQAQQNGWRASGSAAPKPAEPRDTTAFPGGGARNGTDHNSTSEQRKEHHPVLRIEIPRGVRAAVIPLQVRNHRDLPDSVALSAVPVPQDGIYRFPLELIAFEPSTLTINPGAEESARVHLRLTPDFEPGREYWSSIVIAGLETKQIPLAVRIAAPS